MENTNQTMVKTGDENPANRISKDCKHPVMKVMFTKDDVNTKEEFLRCIKCENHFQKDVWKLESQQDINREEWERDVLATETQKPKIKFLMHCVKQGDKRVRVWYSKGNYTKESGIAEETLSIHAKGYDSLPEELNPENNTDTQVDYFDNDTARITTDSPYYKAAHKAYVKRKAILKGRYSDE